MAVDFVALRAKLIAALRANATHTVDILVPNGTVPVARLPHRVTAGAAVAHSTPVVSSDEDEDEGIACRNVLVPGDATVVPDTNMTVRYADGTMWAVKGRVTYDQGGLAIGWKLRVELWPTS